MEAASASGVGGGVEAASASASAVGSVALSCARDNHDASISNIYFKKYAFYEDDGTVWTMWQECDVNSAAGVRQYVNVTWHDAVILPRS